MEKHEKRSLEGILSVLPVVEHAPAHPEHQGPIAPDQGSKRRLIPVGHKTLEEFSIRGVSIVMPSYDAIDLPDEAV